MPSKAGNILVAYHSPALQSGTARSVLFVPPFAEEMNKARRMMAMQARRLAEAGIGVLIPDLYGTGDSEGDFGEARWESWLGDLDTGLEWLQAKSSGKVSLLGLRLGGLLALDWALGAAEALEQIVLWQPVTDGALFVKQFLQLRATSTMTRGGREAQSIEQLRAMLVQGETIEIAGYDLAPQLAAAIQGLRLGSLELTPKVPVRWLELVVGDDLALSPASRRVIAAWEAAGVRVRSQAIMGDPFWTGRNITVVPALIEATTRVLTFGEAA